MVCLSGATRKLVGELQHTTKPFPFRLSTLSRKYLRQLANRVDESVRHPCEIKREPLPETFLSSLPEKSFYSHIPGSIREKIKKGVPKGGKYTFSVGKHRVEVWVVFPPPAPSHEYSRIFHSEELCHEFFESSLSRIAIWLGVAFPFAGAECAQQLTVYLFWTDHHKRLPDSDKDDIEQKHANTAFTYACKPRTEIVLFRLEEWFKVFIHESFHTLGLDFSQMDATESNRQIIRLFPGCSAHTDIRLYETYCEIWAETLNVLMIAYFDVLGRVPSGPPSTPTTGLLPKQMDFVLKKTEGYLAMERTFSVLQARKVLKHYGFTYRDICHGTGNRPSTPKYAETTPVFSYFLLKSIGLYHLNDFLQWCARHLSTSPENYSLHFPKTAEVVREYGTQIGKLSRNAEFIEKMESTSLHFPNRIFRMSVYEMCAIPSEKPTPTRRRGRSLGGCARCTRKRRQS